ncbi:MAG: alpha/beta fold hydrolase, partial [Puniceicoccales bacterium]
MTPRRKKWLAGVLVIYLILLGLSHLKRATAPTVPAPGPDQKTFVAEGFGEDKGTSISLSYLDKGPTDGTPVLLIHGSPVATEVFAPLLDELPSDLRVIAPDLPGHGNSSLDVSDGSFLADADYLHQLLRSLDLEGVHIVAYSRGGGPALQLVKRYPDEFSSLILISSIGVQEQELLGNYTLNHALHSLQLGFFYMVEELVPHFGYLDDAILNSGYARSFYDSDQRPLRQILAGIKVPTLIIHGTRDALVPVSAAREHHRIVPQSELVEMKGGHILIIKKAAEVGKQISGFVHRTHAGMTRMRADASPARLLAAAEAKATTPGAPASGNGLLFLALILFLATFASEDLTCVIAGILAAAGTLSFTVATTACFLGIMVGDLVIFFGGRLFGAQAVRYPPFRWVLTPERLESAQQWFRRRGGIVILTTRFIPGSRLAVYFSAGMARAHTSQFLFYFFIAAAIWTPIVVGLAMLVGNPLLQFFAKFEHWALPGLIGLVLLLLFLTKVVAPLFTARGRRLSYGFWKRKLRWEYWPRWVFYPPVVLWVIYLGFKFRKPSLFTGANPGMEGGGIAFESKRQIYALLAHGNGKIAATLALRPCENPEESLPEIRTFQESLPQAYPLVCKPDYGERGEGVSIVHNETELLEALKIAAPNPIVQEFIPGLEYGIFFEKKPSEPTGRITSITRKIHTSVRGDGTSTLEELILNDSRAVCSFPHFEKIHRHNLRSIPPPGEEYELAALGSHCRGSLFLDGAPLLTPQLTETINQIFAGVEGLCFGRLDVKCPSDDDLQNGNPITVLEFNGITSEPTHIYDPQHSLWYAYRVVFAQWKRAFEIAAE